MLAGLLHDIGKFYILIRFKDYPHLFSDTATEADIMDEWHTVVGHSILVSWNISEEIAGAANGSELASSDKEGADLVDIVSVAAIFSKEAECKLVSETDWDNIDAARRLKLTSDNACEILSDSHEEMQSIIQSLEK